MRALIYRPDNNLEDADIDAATSHMPSARSTIWANSPKYKIMQVASMIYNI